LDGWWPEGYNGSNGWAVGEEIDGMDPAEQDHLDATSIYDILEHEVLPMFYDRDQDGIPRQWIARVKEAMRTLNPVFNTDRMVADYVTKYYQPAGIPVGV
jgi:glucan phosphorylase